MLQERKLKKESTRTMMIIRTKLITSQISVIKDFIDNCELFEELWNVDELYNLEWSANKPNQTKQMDNPILKKKSIDSKESTENNPNFEQKDSSNQEQVFKYTANPSYLNNCDNNQQSMNWVELNAAESQGV